VHAGLVEPLVQDADDHRADQRADDRALSAREARPADHRGRDGGQLEALAAGRHRRVQLRSLDHPRHAREEGTDHVHEDLHPHQGNAGEAGGLAVAAHGVDVLSEPRAVQQQRRQQEDAQHDQHGNGDSQQSPVPHVPEDRRRVGDADGLALVEPPGRSLGDQHRAQGDDEGGHLGLGGAQAVEQADDHGRAQPDRQPQGQARTVWLLAADQDRHGDGAHQRLHRPDRQVDAADQDRQRHPEGHDGVDRDLLHDVDLVVLLPEARDARPPVEERVPVPPEVRQAEAEDQLQGQYGHQQRDQFQDLVAGQPAHGVALGNPEADPLGPLGRSSL